MDYKYFPHESLKETRIRHHKDSEVEPILQYRIAHMLHENTKTLCVKFPGKCEQTNFQVNKTQHEPSRPFYESYLTSPEAKNAYFEGFPEPCLEQRQQKLVRMFRGIG